MYLSVVNSARICFREFSSGSEEFLPARRTQKNFLLDQMNFFQPEELRRTLPGQKNFFQPEELRRIFYWVGRISSSQKNSEEFSTRSKEFLPARRTQKNFLPARRTQNFLLNQKNFFKPKELRRIFYWIRRISSNQKNSEFSTGSEECLPARRTQKNFPLGQKNFFQPEELRRIFY